MIVVANGLVTKYEKRPKSDSNSPGAIDVTGTRSAASITQATGVGWAGSKRSRSLPEPSNSVPVDESYASGVPGGVRVDDMAEPSSVIRVTNPTGRHWDGTFPLKPGRSTEPACPIRDADDAGRL